MIRIHWIFISYLVICSCIYSSYSYAAEPRAVGDFTTTDILELFRENKGLSPYDYLHNYLRGLEQTFDVGGFHAFRVDPSGVSLIAYERDASGKLVEVVLKNQDDILRHFTPAGPEKANELWSRIVNANAKLETGGEKSLFFSYEPLGTTRLAQNKESILPFSRLKITPLLNQASRITSFDLPPRNAFGSHGILPIPPNSSPGVYHFINNAWELLEPLSPLQPPRLLPPQVAQEAKPIPASPSARESYAAKLKDHVNDVRTPRPRSGSIPLETTRIPANATAEMFIKTPAAAQATTMLGVLGKVAGTVGLVVTGYDYFTENPRERALIQYMDAMREYEAVRGNSVTGTVGSRLNRTFVNVMINFGFDDIGDALTQGDFTADAARQIADGLLRLTRDGGYGKKIIDDLANDIEFRRGLMEYGIDLNILPPMRPKPPVPTPMDDSWDPFRGMNPTQ